MSSTTGPADPQVLSQLERQQAELQVREREILELAYLRRSDGVERMRDAVRRLGELGSPAGILARAPQEIGSSSQFDRVLISEVSNGQLTPRTLWERDATANTQQTPPDVKIPLAYPLVEQEALGSRRPQIVVATTAGPRAPAQLTERFGWTEYVVASIVVESEVIGMLHADATASGRRLDELDLEVTATACGGLGEVFDRAVLRQTLQRHRAELQTAVGWLSGRLRAIATEPRGIVVGTGGEGVDRDVVDSLTPREREILTLMAKGLTNAAIGEALVVREGTVKYHVKNVLRKLGARSRADAVARYVRAGGAPPS